MKAKIQNRLSKEQILDGATYLLNDMAEYITEDELEDIEGVTLKTIKYALKLKDIDEVVRILEWFKIFLGKKEDYRQEEFKSIKNVIDGLKKL
jgi:hypothetical protein